MFSINRAFTTPKSVLSVDAKLELKKGRPHEAVFVKINHYEEKREAAMLLDAHALRAFALACGELRETGQSSFRKYTQSGGCRSTLSCGRSGEAYFINIERSCAHGTVKLEHIFGHYSLPAFTQTLTLMADETEKALFAAQSKQEGGSHG